MTAYYNEMNEYAAGWLENLIAAGHIAPGVVDRRDIRDVVPSDLFGFTQCHFFAGVGVWSHALRSAGWSDDRPVWTGSCPCQPFSAAGRGDGFVDERHLWPAFRWLIQHCHPTTVFGEQVASSIVTGKFVNSDVQHLWGNKATLGILKNRLEGDLSLRLQGLPEQVRAILERRSQGFDLDAGESSFERSQVESCGEGNTVRSDEGMDRAEVRNRVVRGDRDPIQHGDCAGLEYAVIGSAETRGGIYQEEHESDPVCPEYGVWGLGGGEISPNSGSEIAETLCQIRYSIDWIDADIEGQGGNSWVDTLQVDLEALDYAFGCVPFPAAGVGAPHIRDRLYWMADAMRDGAEHIARSRLGSQATADGGNGNLSRERLWLGVEGSLGRLDHHHHQGSQGYSGDGDGGRGRTGAPGSIAATGISDGLADDDDDGFSAPPIARIHDTEHHAESRCNLGGRAGPTNGLWGDADWLLCRDGKWRPVEPGTFPLAHGAASRVGRLRAYGNAIVAEAAEAFIRAYLEHEADQHLARASRLTAPAIEDMLG